MMGHHYKGLSNKKVFAGQIFRNRRFDSRV